MTATLAFLLHSTIPQIQEASLELVRTHSGKKVQYHNDWEQKIEDTLQAVCVDIENNRHSEAIDSALTKINSILGNDCDSQKSSINMFALLLSRFLIHGPVNVRLTLELHTALAIAFNNSGRFGEAFAAATATEQILVRRSLTVFDDQDYDDYLRYLAIVQQAVALYCTSKYSRTLGKLQEAGLLIKPDSPCFTAYQIFKTSVALQIKTQPKVAPENLSENDEYLC